MLFGFSSPGPLGKGYRADAVDQVIDQVKAAAVRQSPLSREELAEHIQRLPSTRTGRRYDTDEVDRYLANKLRDVPRDPAETVGTVPEAADQGAARSADAGSVSDSGSEPKADPGPNAAGNPNAVAGNIAAPDGQQTPGAPGNAHDAPRQIGTSRLTADDVENTRFSMVKFREGYRLEDVDNLLDEIAATLAGRGHLSVEDVAHCKFRATSFREGYDQGQVDAFLNTVVATLREKESS